MGLFGNKNNDNVSVDYVRINLLAKLGEENVENGKYREAINYIHEFFELMNRNSFSDLQHLIQPCYFNLALSYSNSGDHENAIKYWSKFIQFDKRNLDAYLERMRSYFALNKISEGLLDIESALKLNPNRTDLYINKGIGYIKLGNKTEARMALSIAVKNGNDDAQEYIDKYC